MALRPWLRLLRVPLAPTAAADVLAACALAHGLAGVPLGAPGLAGWAGLAATALLVYGAGMALNDVADRRRDARLAPDRPLPSGEVPVAGAALLVVVLAAGAVLLGGGPSGDRRVVAGAVGLAALYDLGLKRWLVPGAIAMGGVRLANAAVGVLPLVTAGRAPPWVLLAPAAIGLASAAALVLSTTEEAPAPRRALAARAMTVLAFGGAGALAALGGRPGLLGVAVAAMVVSSAAFGRRPRPGPVKRQVLEMLLGLYVLAGVLATGADGPGFAVLALAAAWVLAIASQLLVRALGPRAGRGARAAP